MSRYAQESWVGSAMLLRATARATEGEDYKNRGRAERNISAAQKCEGFVGKVCKACAGAEGGAGVGSGTRPRPEAFAEGHGLLSGRPSEARRGRSSR
jgi:hypothetical protein